jgi:hypothetical protein
MDPSVPRRVSCDTLNPSRAHGAQAKDGQLGRKEADLRAASVLAAAVRGFPASGRVRALRVSLAGSGTTVRTR